MALLSEHLNPLHKINSLSILSGYYDETGIRRLVLIEKGLNRIVMLPQQVRGAIEGGEPLHAIVTLQQLTKSAPLL
jgi:hypothetical protein